VDTMRNPPKLWSPKDIQHFTGNHALPKPHLRDLPLTSSLRSHLPADLSGTVSETLFPAYVLDLKKTCCREQVADPRMVALFTLLSPK